MINSVQFQDKKSPYAPFLKPNGQNYAIVKPFGPMEDDHEFKKVEKDKKRRALGISIATSAVFTVGVAWFLLKGLPHGAFAKKATDTLDLNTKILNQAENYNSTLGKIRLAGLKVRRRITKFVKGFCNIMPLKYILVEKYVRKVPVFDKISDWTTRYFEKVSKASVDKSYAKTMKRFDKMYTRFFSENEKIRSQKVIDKITIDGKVYTREQALNEIEKMIPNVKKLMDSGFSGVPREKRYIMTNAALADLPENIMEASWRNMQGFVKSKDYEHFLSEKYSAAAKIDQMARVNTCRLPLTNDVTDSYTQLNHARASFHEFISPNDRESLAILDLIKDQLNKLKVLGKDVSDVERKEIDKRMGVLLDRLSDRVKCTDTYDKTTLNKIAEQIQNFSNIIGQNEKGEIQKILTIYNKLLPDAEYRTLKLEVNKTMSSLHRSINLESDKLFDKIRDIKIGAPSMDALGILSSAGMLGWGLSRADDKNERISIGLRYCLPVLGGMMTALYCTVGLVSGGTALLVGTLSGIAINKLGGFVDTSIKKYQNKDLKMPNMKDVKDLAEPIKKPSFN